MEDKLEEFIDYYVSDINTLKIQTHIELILEEIKAYLVKITYDSFDFFHEIVKTVNFPMLIYPKDSNS